MNREELLAKWVDQPPTTPIAQYLRDAEREAAVESVGDVGHALDLGSEATVARELSADRLSRLDFSTAAGETAREVLGTQVTEYATTDPGSPRLPFDDDAFDAAVSVGPYDWRFLDVGTLTAEVRRVLEPGGRFVLTVPTTRSPYAHGARHRFRFFDPDEAARLLAPAWTEYDERLVYQLPTTAQRVVSTLPGRLQEPFVDFCVAATDRLDASGDRSEASYLVVGAERAPYERWLDDAVGALFRPADEAGFWDTTRGTFLRAQSYEATDGEFVWTPDRDEQWRYGPFALMGAMQWRVSAFGTARYDDRLRASLSFFADTVADTDTLEPIPSYGLGPLLVAFSLAEDAFGGWVDTARELASYTRETVAFDDSEDSLVLYGWSYLADRVDDPDLDSAIADAMWAVADRQSPTTGLFAFDNSTTLRHQNQQYTCWGLAKAIEYTGATGYLENVQRCLEYTVDERMLDDGAFIWEDVGPLRKHGTEAVYETLYDRDVPYWHLLFACHQTFFVNAVAHYRAAGGDRPFDTEVRTAMAWLTGDNPRGVDLVAASGLGVPLRFLTLDGRIDVPGQQFKGSYEIGSHVMALVNLLSW